MVESTETVDVAVTGVSGRGGGLLHRCTEMPDVAIPAICDVSEENLDAATKTIVDSGRPEPDTFADHGTMVTDADLDAVIIATPWHHHIPMAIEAMEAGVYVGLEVGPAPSLRACWDLVKTAESTGSHCMLLENCCYYRDVLAVLTMLRQDLFGELIHCRGGYGHDLRGRIVTGRSDGSNGTDTRDYRGVENEMRNADLYPTHGVGPIAKFLDINAGNRFLTLTSTASKSRGLSDWAETTLDADHPNRDIDWSIGDVITTVLTCANGETVVITHDVSLPRPYSNMYHVQGTGGLWKRTAESFDTPEDAPGMCLESFVHLEDHSPAHTWEDFEPYRSEYEHPIWREYVDIGPKHGHGGIDFLVTRAFVSAVKRGQRPPIDVYDAATWMAITPLSERSIARGSMPVDVPDFTDGSWHRRSTRYAADDGPLAADLRRHHG